MRCIIVASVQRYGGKSAVAASLIQEATARGLQTAYFKPLGTLPVMTATGIIDQDAAYLCAIASCQAPPEIVCPVVVTHELVEDIVAGRAPDLAELVRSAYPLASGNADLVVVEGPRDLAEGAASGLDLLSLTEMLDADVLLVDRPGMQEMPEETLLARAILGERLLGVVYNDVPHARADILEATIPGFLEQRGVRVFGVIRHDPRLSSVTAAEIADALDGTVLSAEDRLDEPIESFMVGAMGQEKALRYFRRRARKAVVTGGDRSDVQLAALETDTKAVILTGNLPPSTLVLSRAEELGVPMILVGMDTLSAVERMETLLGHVRIHDTAKVARIREMFSASVDVDAIFDAIGT